MQDYIMLYLMVLWMLPIWWVGMRGLIASLWLMLKVTHLPPTNLPHPKPHPMAHYRRGEGREETTPKAPHVTLPRWP